MAEEEHQCPECPPVEDCPPPGAPAWMATFSDLVTLLLTFFVLLYAMSKTDESKFQSVAGSIRKAFAGNAMKIGETIQLGKSPDDSPTQIESQDPVEPFPIDLLTTEGILDKFEINKESDEDLAQMKKVVADYDLAESVDVYEMKAGIKIRVKDRILFSKNTVKMANKGVIPVFDKVVKLMQDNNWTIFVEGYAEPGENLNGNTSTDAYLLSAKRAQEVTTALIKRGVRAEKITTLFYGSSRHVKGDNGKKVEFVLRKIDLKTEGKRVRAQ